MIRREFFQRGFTLLEVLVALAVLAIALGALIKAAAQSADNIAYLRDRTLAGWVASNKINELMLLPNWPGLGESEGVSTLAGREWRWRLQVSQTEDGDIRRMDVAVAANDDDGDDDDAALVNLAAFKGRP